MNLTIIADDKAVGVDGYYFGEFDLTDLDPKIHAVHWSHTEGEIQWKDRNIQNTIIDNYDEFEWVYHAWLERKAFEDAKAINPYHGMSPEEEYTTSLADKLTELSQAYSLIILRDSPAPGDIIKLLKKLRKELKGNASQKDKNDLDSAVTIDSYLDSVTLSYNNAKNWLEGPDRTSQEIQAYDVKVDPNWPVM